MDWNKIKQEQPKAWEKLQVWYLDKLGCALDFDNDGKNIGHWFTDGCHVVMMFANFNVRDLYSFFDEQGIYINILLWADHGWSWDIRNDKFEILLYFQYLIIYIF